jgi:hypothetical protein
MTTTVGADWPAPDCGDLGCGAVDCGAVDCGAVGCGDLGCGDLGCGDLGCGAVDCGGLGCEESLIGVSVQVGRPSVRQGAGALPSI